MPPKLKSQKLSLEDDDVLEKKVEIAVYFLFSYPWEIFIHCMVEREHFFSGLENKDNLRPVQRSRRARSGQAGCGGYHQEVQRYGQVVFPFKRE